MDSLGITMKESTRVTIMNDQCNNCYRRYWHVKLAKWVYSRETVGMMCQLCGHDYAKPDDKKEVTDG